MDNFFYKKFQKKTDQELKDVLIEEEKYTSEAVTAAYVILRKRNVNLADFSGIETEINAQQNEINSSQEVHTEKKSILDSKRPELFSKKTILGFSIFFSTIFGVALMMINMQGIKSQKGKKQVLLFGIAYFLFTITIAPLFKTSFSLLALLLNVLGATILNEYFWNTFIGKNVVYKKRNWLKPALLSLLITSILIGILLRSL